jgi:hypothetical protein
MEYNQKRTGKETLYHSIIELSNKCSFPLLIHPMRMKCPSNKNTTNQKNKKNLDKKILRFIFLHYTWDYFPQFDLLPSSFISTQTSTTQQNKEPIWRRTEKSIQNQAKSMKKPQKKKEENNQADKKQYEDSQRSTTQHYNTLFLFHPLKKK